MLWKPEEDQQLVDYWKSGQSASLIAERFPGRTRNAVIGRVHRLGMSKKRTAETHRRISRTMTRLRKIERQEREARQPKVTQASRIQALLKSEPLPEDIATDIAKVSITDLEPHHCRWVCAPVKNIFEPVHCGNSRVLGTPYCEAHARRAYKPAAPPQPRPLTTNSLTPAGLKVEA
jgi:GcrA cell cycle regulator